MASGLVLRRRMLYRAGCRWLLPGGSDSSGSACAGDCGVGETGNREDAGQTGVFSGWRNPYGCADREFGRTSCGGAGFASTVCEEASHRRCFGCRESERLFVSGHTTERKGVKAPSETGDRYDCRPPRRIPPHHGKRAAACRKTGDAFGVDPGKWVVTAEGRADCGIFRTDRREAATQDLCALLVGRRPQWSISGGIPHRV